MGELACCGHFMNFKLGISSLWCNLCYISVDKRFNSEVTTSECLHSATETLIVAAKHFKVFIG